MRSNSEIFEEVQARGLVNEVIDRARALRKGRLARSTFYRAREMGGATPAQRLIIRVAATLLEELDAKKEQPAEAAA